MWELWSRFKPAVPRLSTDSYTSLSSVRSFARTVTFKDISIHLPDGAEAAPSTKEDYRDEDKVEKEKLIIIVVGLPGRGKTFLCNKLVSYLTWIGHDTCHFNVGNYRRRLNVDDQMHDASFFDHTNQRAMEIRKQALMTALKEMLCSLDQGECQVALFDATNTTEDRRNFLKEQFEGKYEYMFIESICNDEAVLEQNYRAKMIYSPDYCHMNPQEAMTDFKERIKKYAQVYEPIADRNLQFIKMIDLVTGHGYLDVNRISGYIGGKIVFFLMQISKAGVNQVRKIWLTRHGESEYNRMGLIGGDSNLSPKGTAYAKILPEKLDHRLALLKETTGYEVPLTVWTSTLRRTNQTARFLSFPKLRWKALDEINAGRCDGMSYQEIEQQMPEEFKARQEDKLTYRYPFGESYLDVIQRLEPVIIEMERETESICVISHQAVIRAIYTYFMRIPLEQCPTIDIPLHSIIELTPLPDGTMKSEFIPVEVPSVPRSSFQSIQRSNTLDKSPQDCSYIGMSKSL